MSSPFRFKQFVVHQDRCAMKVGTDGVLLGAATSLAHHPQTILDIGAGTGVVALMLAQRSHAETIDAVELDGDAYEQCVENFEASPWSDRLFCYHASFQEFCSEMEESYDLIVTNPPFFTESVSSGNPSRDQARQNSALPFEQLFHGIAQLLSKGGVCSLIVPYTEEEMVVGEGSRNGLYTFDILRIKGNPEAPIKRSILQFCPTPKSICERELTIERARHQFTENYTALTKEFYLKL